MQMVDTLLAAVVAESDIDIPGAAGILQVFDYPLMDKLAYQGGFELEDSTDLRSEFEAAHTVVDMEMRWFAKIHSKMGFVMVA